MKISDYPLIFLEISLLIGNEYQLSVCDRQELGAPSIAGPWARAQSAPQWERCACSGYGNYIYRILQLSLDILYVTGRSPDHVTVAI